MDRQVVIDEREGANTGDFPLRKKTALQLLVENQVKEWVGMEEIENILEVHGSFEKNNSDLS